MADTEIRNDNIGELTRKAEEAIWLYDDEKEEANRNQYMCLPENFVVFPQGLLELVREKYGDLVEGDLFHFIKDCGVSRNVELSMPTIKNWLTQKANPQANDDIRTRTQIYKLCFALNFNVEETERFFSKVYLCRPFDCRNVDEVIYLFCMRQGLSYSKAQELISEAKEVMQTESENGNNYSETRVLNLNIRKIMDEKTLLSFIEKNKESFRKNNRTAIKRYNELIEEAERLTKISNETVSVDTLLEKIYGFDLVALQKSNKELTIKKKSRFLSIVTMNFPQKQKLHEIKEGKASYDTIRKALILMKFYVFYKQAIKYNPSDLFDDFRQETNDLLEECGYGYLYSRNPYDWLFMHCAASCDYYPLDEFKNILVDMIPFE